jgi:hypothetical protein
MENTFFINFRQKYYSKSIYSKKLGSKNFRQNLLKHKWWCEQVSPGYQSNEWFDCTRGPYFRNPIAKICETGNHVPFSADLISFVSPIIPESDYTISSLIDVPLPERDEHEKKKKGRIRGIPADKSGWRFKGLQLNAYPLHSSYDWQRLGYYKMRMMANKEDINYPEEKYFMQSHMHLQEYIPTVVILTSPSIFISDRFTPDLDGLVLDGLNKIQAASEVACPVRVILIEKKKQVREPELYDDVSDDGIDAYSDGIDAYPSKHRQTRHSKKSPMLEPKKTKYKKHYKKTLVM